MKKNYSTIYILLIFIALIFTPACDWFNPEPDPISIITTSLPDAEKFESYETVIKLNGGSGNYNMSISSGILPSGLSLNNSGTISGTTTADKGLYTFGLQVVDSDDSSNSASAQLSITVIDPVEIVTSTLPDGIEGNNYSIPIVATGASGNYNFSVSSSGGNLPSGLTIDQEGIISGTINDGPADYTFTVRAVDQIDQTDYDTQVFTIRVIGKVAINTTSLPVGVTNEIYSASIDASGGYGVYSFSITGGALPSGLVLSANGNISGTVTAPMGTYSFTVRAEDQTDSSNYDTQAFSLDVIERVIITTSALPGGTIGSAYSAQLAADGGSGNILFTITGGALPSGLALSANGAISGIIDSAEGMYSLTIHAEDQADSTNSDSRNLSITVIAPVNITTTSLHDGLAGRTYSAAIYAAGGSGSYTFSLSSGSLPGGLSLGQDGTVAGTINAPVGTYTFAVQAADQTDSASYDTQSLSIRIIEPIAITTSSLPEGITGRSYTASLDANGGSGTYRFTIAGGALPSGLTLNTNGTISGVINGNIGNYVITIRAEDQNNPVNFDTTALLLKVVAPVTITTSSLSSGTTGEPYSETVTANGGSGSYIFSVSSGTLPGGLNLAPDGSVSGTITAPEGNYSFSITGTDQYNSANSDTRTLSITVNAPMEPVALLTASLDDGISGRSYSEVINASGGSGSYIFNISSGALPGGLSLAQDGTITGTIIANAGIYTFTVTAADATDSSNADSRSLSINVAGQVTITTSSLPDGMTEEPYSETVTANGGSGNYIFSINSGALPSGLNFASDGTIAGTITAVPGAYSFSVKAEDQLNSDNSDTKTLSITVIPQPEQVVLLTTSLPAGITGKSYSQTLNASGGTGAYTFTISSGALPGGLSLAQNGTISGTINSGAGMYTFSVTVGDTNDSSNSDSGSLSISVAEPVTIATTSLPSGISGIAYTASISANGGSGNYTYSIQSGILPSGLNLASNGTISGVATASGTFTFTVRSADQDNLSNFDTATLSVTIVEPVNITTTSLPEGIAGTSYTASINANGGSGSYTWSIQSGTLPGGLNLGSNGAISGTPSTSGTYSFTVKATDQSNPANSDTAALSITIVEPVNITTTSLPDGLNRDSYTAAINAIGGSGNLTFSLSSGTLPTGLGLGQNGTITGTINTNAGIYTFSVRATDTLNSSNSDTTSLSITVIEPVTLTTTTLPDGVVGISYTSSLNADGGSGSYTYSLESGSLPGGLTLGLNGSIAGAPSASGTYSFTVKAADQSNPSNSDTAALSVTIVDPVTITTTSLPDGLDGDSYTATINASGGYGSHTFSLSSGALPAGLNLNQNGTISGTIDASAGVYTLSVTAVDQANSENFDTQTLSIRVIGKVVLTTSSFPDGIRGNSYSTTLTAEGGYGSYRFSLTNGSLPLGLSLDPNGTISGTITGNAGNYILTIQAEDQNNPENFDSRSVLLKVVDPVSITTATLQDAITGKPYSASINANGGYGDYSFSVTGGALPSGLSMSQNGTVSGTVTASAGDYSFTITAVDTSNGALSDSRILSITVVPPVEVITTSLPDGVENTTYSESIHATGGSGDYLFSIASGTLPAGLNLAQDGTIAGTISASAGVYTFSVTAQDVLNSANSDSRSLSIRVIETVTITTTTVPSGITGASYTTALSASGGYGSYNFTLVNGFLPAGLTLGTNGTISGVATESGDFIFTVRAADQINPANADTKSFTMSVAEPVLITTTTLADALVGDMYSEVILATGGFGGHTFSITSGSLPAGLSLSSNGNISGTINGSAGTYSFTVRAVDVTVSNNYDTATLSITVTEPIVIGTASLPDGMIGDSYTASIGAQGGSGNIIFSLTSGNLPSGLTLGSNGAITGVMGGSPGTYSFSIQASDQADPSNYDTQTFSITAIAPVSITTTTLPEVSVGVEYLQTILATGGSGNYLFSLESGTLPSGLAFYQDGSLYGTANGAVGTYTFTIEAADASDATNFATRSYSIVVINPVEITTSALPNGNVTSAYMAILSASGGSGSYTWSLASGDLPTDLALYSNGSLSGTINDVPGTYTFTAIVTDSADPTNSDTRVFSINVIDAIRITTDNPLPYGDQDTPYNSVIEAAGGSGNYFFTIESGALPSGLALYSDGSISGTVTAGPGNYDFTAMVEDQASPGSTASKNFTISIAAFAPDAYEPDNDSSTTNTIIPGSGSQEHSFHVEDDIDFMYVDFTGVAPGTRFVIKTSFLSMSTDTKIELLNQDGTRVFYNDDISSGNMYSKGIFTCDEPGIYMLIVSMYDYSSFDTGDYIVSVDEIENVSITGAGGINQIDWNLYKATNVRAYVYISLFGAPDNPPSVDSSAWSEQVTDTMENLNTESYVHFTNNATAVRYFRDTDVDYFVSCETPVSISSELITFMTDDGNKAYDWRPNGQNLDIAISVELMYIQDADRWIMVVVTYERVSNFTGSAAPDCPEVEQFMLVDRYM